MILSIFQTNNFSSIDTAYLSGSINSLTILLRNRSHSLYTCPCPPSFLTPPSQMNFLYPLSPTKWTRFWRYSIHVKARTIWFRLLHNRIPHSSLLHHRFPARFTSSLCLRCQTEPDSLYHFFFSCPLLSFVWSQVGDSFISNTTSQTLSSFLTLALKALQTVPNFPSRDPTITVVPHLSSVQIITCTIQAIWSSHWAFIFNDAQFLPCTVNSAALELIHQLGNELDTTSNLLKKNNTRSIYNV
ncbi:hypothetical protein BD770DRAFT_394783 [Pilaira anomala]|nr:hypothetical protein BD770DRAFT_394783 [Pilaira anomala]